LRSVLLSIRCSSLVLVFFLQLPPPPSSPLFPYTTLFRSDGTQVVLGEIGQKMLLENDRVRLWEVALAPGETQPWHLHHNPYLVRSEEHTSELQSRENLVCRLLLEKKKKNK